MVCHYDWLSSAVLQQQMRHNHDSATRDKLLVTGFCLLTDKDDAFSAVSGHPSHTYPSFLMPRVHFFEGLLAHTPHLL
jgi:hypothetical protein